MCGASDGAHDSSLGNGNQNQHFTHAAPEALGIEDGVGERRWSVPVAILGERRSQATENPVRSPAFAWRTIKSLRPRPLGSIGDLIVGQV
jgi:hypothetical protein